jgi:hypothetical protein
LVAGLLLFRILYYLVPFAFALSLLGIRELVMMRSGKPVPPPRLVRAASPLRSEIEAEKSDAG